MTKKNTKNINRKQIKDNYSFKEMDITFDGARDIQHIYSLAREFGHRDSKFDEAFNQFDEINKQFKAIKLTPDLIDLMNSLPKKVGFLMLIDGFVNEFEHVGFFAEKVDLTIWDTIAAHDSRLATIAKILIKSRKKNK